VSVHIASLQNDEKVSKERLPALEKTLRKLAAGFVGLADDAEDFYVYNATNLWLSRCYHCQEIAVWRHDRLVWPIAHEAPAANSDIPADVRADYDEAAKIVQLSPRGAAGLLRLAIQKLCLALGQSGKDLNQDIANLVVLGLDGRIQRALDIVRVIGNNAVHPGQIDLRDDTATAMQLFSLVNLIADRMITEPKTIESMYAKLPDGAREQIEARDKKRP
jgi:hypothetical protein